MKAVSTTRTLISQRSLLTAACLLGAMVLGGCYGRQSAGPDGEVSPSLEGAARPAADSSAAAASLAPKDEVSAPRAAAEAASPGGRYTATAYLRMSREEPYVVFPAAAAAGADYAFYKRTQMELMKTRFVLAAALRKPDSSLPCLRQGPARRDPAGWLAGQLRIDSPGDAEIVRVSLSGDDVEAAVALVNAVVHACLEEVAGLEMEKRTKQLDQLDRLLAEKEEELRSSRNLRNQLAEHVGTAETPAGSVGQQLALEEVLDARKDLSAARNDLRRAQAERRADDALLSNPTSTEVPDYEVDALAQNDAMIGQVLTPLVAELKKKSARQQSRGRGSGGREAEGGASRDRRAARRASPRPGGAEAGGHRGRNRPPASADLRHRATRGRLPGGAGTTGESSRPRPPNQHRVGGGAGQDRAAGGSGPRRGPPAGTRRRSSCRPGRESPCCKPPKSRRKAAARSL